MGRKDSVDEIPAEPARAVAERGESRPGESRPGESQYLTFDVAGEEYAIAILRIVEIVALDALTQVPTTPPWIRGVMNLRGGVVPVVDLALKFGLPESPVTRKTCVVILEVDLEGEPTVMGVMVDEVRRVLDLAVEAIEEPPPFGTRVRVEFLVGLGKVDGDGRFVLVLDIDRILSTEELLAVAEAPQAAAAGAPEAGVEADDSEAAP